MSAEVLALARVAGLPASAVLELAADELAEWAQALGERRRAMAALRESVVACAFERLSSAAPPERRLLLAVKRAAYNGRPLERLREHELWPRVRELLAPWGERLACGEAELAEAERELARRWAVEEGRQRAALWRRVDEPALLRGIALANPVLAGKLRRLRQSAELPASRRELKAEASLLRYVSRAALKLSPFSTLSPTATARLSSLGRRAALSFEPSLAEENAILRLRRYLPEQFAWLLLRHPALRQACRLRLNPSLTVLEEDRWLFVAPGGWSVASGENDRLVWRAPALSKVSLQGPLIARLRETLGQRELAYEEVVADLHAAFGEALGEDVAEPILREKIEALLELGFLDLVTPWPSNEMHLERRLAEWLEEVQPQGLESTRDHLRALADLEAGYAAHARPEEVPRRVDEHLDAAWASARSVLLADCKAPLARVRDCDLYEDVLLTARDGGRDVVMADRAELSGVLADLTPWIRLAWLKGHRLDWLRSLGEFLRRSWPGEERVPLPRVLDASAALWREFQRFLTERRRARDGWSTTFNPYQLERVSRLEEARKHCWSGLRRLIEEEGGKGSIAPSKLEHLLELSAPEDVSSASATVQLQFCGQDDKIWTLNRTFEPGGRYFSRFVGVMPESRRASYVTALRGVVLPPRELGGGHLLDLMWSLRDTLNLHQQQTETVLQVPGETLAANCGPRLRLTDLWLCAGAPRELPRLVTADGTPQLPVFLGGVGGQYLPGYLRFLQMLGLGEIDHFAPPTVRRSAEGGAVQDRVTIGRAVVQRKRWFLPAEPLRARFGERSDSEAYAEVQAWRSEHGLPERLFWIEPVRRGAQTGFKPQYLDLTSPLFLQHLPAALEEAGDELVFEEQLPNPAAFPRDGEGRPWAVELQVDSLLLLPTEMEASETN